MTESSEFKIYISPMPILSSEGVIYNELPFAKLTSSIYIRDVDDETLEELSNKLVENTNIYIPYITSENIKRVYRILHLINDLAQQKNILYKITKYC